MKFNTEPPGRRGRKVTTSGLLLICICFFLPAVEASCGGPPPVPFSGTVKNPFNLLLWGLPFLFAFVCLVLYGLRWLVARPKGIKCLTVITCIVSILFLAYPCCGLAALFIGDIAESRAEKSGQSVWGWAVILIGAAVALLRTLAFLVARRRARRSTTPPDECRKPSTLRRLWCLISDGRGVNYATSLFVLACVFFLAWVCCWDWEPGGLGSPIWTLGGSAVLLTLTLIFLVRLRFAARAPMCVFFCAVSFYAFFIWQMLRYAPLYGLPLSVLGCMLVMAGVLEEIIEVRSWKEGGGEGEQALGVQEAHLLRQGPDGINAWNRQRKDSDAALDLSDVDLANLDLRGADLSDAKKLSRDQLAGADLARADLPEDVNWTEPLKNINQACTHAKNLFLTLIGACFFCVLTVAGSEVAYLGATVKLPVIGLMVSMDSFYALAPALLLGLYVYFHIYLERLWEKLADLPAVFPDGAALDQKVHPWLLIGLMRAHLPQLRGTRPALWGLQRGYAMVGAYWLAPMTLLVLWWGYLHNGSLPMLVWHTMIVAASLVARYTFRGAITRATAGENHRDTGPPRGGSRFRKWTQPLVVCHMLVVYWLVPVSARTPELVRNIARPNLHHQDLHGKYLAGAHLAHANLAFTNLRKATLRDSTLTNAILRGAELGEADLRGARLEGADLRGAYLQRADLTDANLQRADLRGADLQGADLHGADLTDADLRGADLQRADMRFTTLLRIIWRGERNRTQTNFDLFKIRVVQFGNRTQTNFYLANIYGVQDDSDGFAGWAREHGAASTESDQEWHAYIKEMPETYVEWKMWAKPTFKEWKRKKDAEKARDGGHGRGPGQ